MAHSAPLLESEDDDRDIVTLRLLIELPRSLPRIRPEEDISDNPFGDIVAYLSWDAFMPEPGVEIIIMLPTRQPENYIKLPGIGNADLIPEPVGGEDEHVPGEDVVVSDGGCGGHVWRSPAVEVENLLRLERRRTEVREEPGGHAQRRLELVVPQGFEERVS